MNSSSIEITLDRAPLRALGYSLEELQQFIHFASTALYQEYPGVCIILRLGRSQEIRAEGHEETAESILQEVTGRLWSEWREIWAEVRSNTATEQSWEPDICDVYDDEALRGMEGDAAPAMWCDGQDMPPADWDGYEAHRSKREPKEMIPANAGNEVSEERPAKAPLVKKAPKRNAPPKKGGESKRGKKK